MSNSDLENGEWARSKRRHSRWGEGKLDDSRPQWGAASECEPSARAQSGALDVGEAQGKVESCVATDI